MTDEKRTATRINVKWPIKLLRKDKTYVEGTVRNVSASGFNVDTRNYVISENETVMIETSFFFKNKPYKIHAIAKVIFKTIHAGGQDYNYGLKVIQMKDVDQELLLSIIKNKT